MATLALALIVKNEIHNLPILFESVKGCVDAIYVTDTGSTDGTIEWVVEANRNKTYGCPIHLQYFSWINDFSAARNASFSPVVEDYVLWLDADDSLRDKGAFVEWKNTIMPICDYWLATYHYAIGKQRESLCSFARERVVKRSRGFKWKYFVHEGIIPTGNVQAMFASSWSVEHRRTPEDLAADKGRNLRLFELNPDQIDARMLYYWGKELFENGKPLEAYSKLVEAAKKPELDSHDRVLAIQYGATAAQVLKQYPESVDLAVRGLQLAPGRAEFFALIGDALAAMNQVREAVPYYEAAKNCDYREPTKFSGPIFSSRHAYTIWPRVQLARMFFAMGRLEDALAQAREAIALGDQQDAVAIEAEIVKLQTKASFPKAGEGEQTTDIIITAPPVGLYDWDDDVYKTYGCGGSETAAIEMAHHLHNITGRKVIIYNPRKDVKEFGGVSYRPAETLADYLVTKTPAVHIAWRHTDKLTSAKSYVWCHDLFAPGVENPENYDYVLALSPFHKQYLTGLFGVPPEKVIVTGNGIAPSRWNGAKPEKENVVVFSSSPDRGIAQALRVMDLVVKEMPDVKFKAYYGFDNMMKAGRSEEAYALQQMFNERPWAEMVGNITQDKLTGELLKAKVWLYPTNFLETFGITAIEMAVSQVYPVVRSYGALPDTLKDEPCDLINRPCETPDDIAYYAERTIAALREEKWQLMRSSPEKYSWEAVAHSWVKFMGLNA